MKTLLSFLDNEFPHDLSLSRGWCFVLASLEAGLSTLVCWFICYATIYIASVEKNLLGYLEYPFYIQAWIGVGLFFIYPLTLLLSPWRRLFPITQYGMLVMGAVSLGSTAILACAVLYVGMTGANYEAGIDALLWQLFPPLLALGCLLRFHCCRTQAHYFYLGALLKGTLQN